METYTNNRSNRLWGEEISPTRKLTYLAVMIALCSVANMFSIDLGIFKLSFTTATFLIIAYLFGPLLGGLVAFLSDFIGFIVMPSSSGAYSPFIGLCNALFVAILGIAFALLLKKRNFVLSSIIGFVVAHILCSVFLNSYIVSTLFSSSGFWVIVWKRVLFQTPVNIFNCVLGILLLKGLSKISFFNLKIDK